MYLQHKNTVLQQQQCSTYHYHIITNHNITFNINHKHKLFQLSTQIRLDQCTTTDQSNRRVSQSEIGMMSLEDVTNPNGTTTD